MAMTEHGVARREGSFDPSGDHATTNARLELGLAALAVLALGALALMLWLNDFLIVGALYDDIFVPWDAGARWYAGQMPSIDFPSSIGPFYYAFHGLAYAAAAGGATTIDKASVIALLVTAPLMATILFTRFPALLAAIALLCLGLWMIAPGQADYTPKVFSHLASYNRHGLVWTALVVILSAVSSRWTSETARGWWYGPVVDGVLAGFCLFLSLFTKITFALPAGLFFGLAMLARHRLQVRPVLATYGGALAVLVGGTAVLELAEPGFISAYVSDLAYAVSVQAEGAFAISNRGDAMTFYLVEALLSALAVFAIVGHIGLRLSLVPAVWAFAALLTLGLTMAQVHDTYAPILAVSTLVFYGVAQANIAMHASPRDRRLLRFSVMPCFILAISVSAISVMQHSLYSQRVAAQPGRYLAFADRGFAFSQGAAPIEAAQLDAARLNSSLTRVADGTVTPDEWNEAGSFQAIESYQYWRDARALLERSAIGQDAHIFCFAFANACPALTRTTPPEHLLLWWHLGRSYALASPPPGALEDTDIILVPKVDRFGYGQAIEEAYAGELARDFVQVRESDFWRLLRRRTSASL